MNFDLSDAETSFITKMLCERGGGPLALTLVKKLTPVYKVFDGQFTRCTTKNRDCAIRNALVITLEKDNVHIKCNGMVVVTPEELRGTVDRMLEELGCDEA